MDTYLKIVKAIIQAQKNYDRELKAIDKLLESVKMPEIKQAKK